MVPQYYWDLYENAGPVFLNGGRNTYYLNGRTKGPAWTWGPWNRDLQTRFGRLRASEAGVFMRDPKDFSWSDWWPKTEELP